MPTAPSSPFPLSSWWTPAEPSRSAPLTRAISVDIAIVGGGLAGLSAAFYLRRELPDADIALLEADAVGSGATSRSTGIVAPGVGGPITVLRRRYGDTKAANMFRGSVAAVQRTIGLIEDERLDCELERNGQLVCSVTPGQDRALQAQHRSFREVGFDIPYLAKDALDEVLVGRAYYSALRHPLAATLNPLALCRSLKARLVSLGVQVFENSPVESIQPGAPVVLRSPAGSVRARQVVMATDGAQPVGLPASGVVPVTGHVLRTAPLTGQQLADIRWQGRDSVVDCRTFFNYYRLTPDNRIIFGGGRVAVPSRRDQSVAPATSENAWQRMALELRTIFPGLAELEITDRWSGRIGSILDRLPRLGRLPAAPGVWFSGGWCGHGIPLSVEAGAEIARRISRPPAGTRTGIGTGPGTGTGTEIAWYREKVPQLPGGPLRDLGLKGYLAGLDRIDRLGGKFGGAASSARQLQAASASGR